MSQTILEISNYQKGMEESPELGFEEVRNVELDTKQGVAKIAFATEKKSGTAVVSLVNYISRGAVGSGGRFNAISENGNVFQINNFGDASSDFSDVGTASVATAWGMAVWKSHLFVAETDKLNVMVLADGKWRPDDGGGFQNINSSVYHHMIVGQDDKLYICAGQAVASLAEVDGQTFSPTNSATYTWTAEALDLPDGYTASCLAEQGVNLMIGSMFQVSAGNEKQYASSRRAEIFPWDRSSDSFFLPIVLEERGISAMISVNNLIYFFAGVEGRCYVTDGTSVREVFRLPYDLVNDAGVLHTAVVLPGALQYYKGKIIFGLMRAVDGGGASAGNYAQVWSYDIERKRLAIENEIASGFSAGSKIGALLPVRKDQYLIGWEDSVPAFGVDRVENDTRYTSYKSVIRSVFYRIGSKAQPIPLVELEYELARPLATGQGVRFSYRTDHSASFTTIATSDFATDGAIQGKTIGLKVWADGAFQLQVEMTTGAASSTTPELRSVKIR